jgi:hypothetical protein
MREIMELLQGEDLRISVRVAGGVRAVQPYEPRTKEEEEQVREEYRAAVARYDYDAAEDVIRGTSPPGGLIGPLDPQDWGHKVTLVIRDRHLLIKWLDPTFPPESYKFTIVNPEAVDRLLVAVGTVQEPDAAVNRNPTVSERPPRPPDGAFAIEHVAWAVRFLRITDPDKLAGLRGKKLQKLVCNTVGPNFWCDARTVQRGKKRADSM